MFMPPIADYEAFCSHCFHSWFLDNFEVFELTDTHLFGNNGAGYLAEPIKCPSCGKMDKHHVVVYSNQKAMVHY